MSTRPVTTIVRVADAKATHFEGVSGHPRTPEDLRLISDAAYWVRATYHDAEEVFRYWAQAPVPAANAHWYIKAGISLDEALGVWEPLFNTDPDGTAAVLDTLGGLLPRRV